MLSLLLMGGSVLTGALKEEGVEYIIAPHGTATILMALTATAIGSSRNRGADTGRPAWYRSHARASLRSIVEPSPMLALACALILTAADDPASPNQPPPGFIALFNGKDLTNWRADEHDASTHWTVKEGVLHYDGHGDSLRTAQDYGDFELFVDWKIERGGDSGIYLRGKPQVQIWDRPEGSGGLYNNKVGPSKPLKVADRPPGQWNTFRIIMKGQKVTVFLNGEKVVDDVPLENYPDYQGPIPATGPIELQHHETPLQFRNIFLKAL